MPTVNMTPATVPPVGTPQIGGTPRPPPNNTLRAMPSQRAVPQGVGPAPLPGKGEGTPQPPQPVGPGPIAVPVDVPVLAPAAAIKKKIMPGDYVRVENDGGDWSGWTGLVIERVVVIGGFLVRFKSGANGEIQPHRLTLVSTGGGP